MHSECTCKGTQMSLVIGLRLNEKLEPSVPLTEHCGKSETVLSKHGVSNHGEAVLSEGKGQPNISTRSPSLPPLYSSQPRR